jgi:Flp pilus assembly protein TadG
MSAEQPQPSRGAQAAPRKRRALEAQALIELTAIGMALLMMTFGVLELGRAYYASTAVTHAARDGARVAMDPTKTNAQVVAAAEAAADPIDLSNVGVSRTTAVGSMATITVTYEFNSFAPFVSAIWGGGPLIFSESATSRVGWLQ